MGPGVFPAAAMVPQQVAPALRQFSLWPRTEIRTCTYELIMAVKSGQEAVNLGNSRVLCPPSLSNRRELIGTLPAFILSNRIKNPTQIGSLSKSSKKQIRDFFAHF
jgi:hypothetical protein